MKAKYLATLHYEPLQIRRILQKVPQELEFVTQFTISQQKGCKVFERREFNRFLVWQQLQIQN
jgi:hypothetical protein